MNIKEWAYLKLGDKSRIEYLTIGRGRNASRKSWKSVRGEQTRMHIGYMCKQMQVACRPEQLSTHTHIYVYIIYIYMYACRMIYHTSTRTHTHAHSSHSRTFTPCFQVRKGKKESSAKCVSVSIAALILCLVAHVNLWKPLLKGLAGISSMFQCNRGFGKSPFCSRSFTVRVVQ